jgi:HEAT repeat protein
MSHTPPEVRFVRALAAGILREGEGAALAAGAALRDFLAAEKSLVLEVQFTGFTRRGEQLGGVHPLFLRAAAQLIVLRVNRIGFTADAGEADLRALFDAVSRPAAEQPDGGVVETLAAAAPSGVFLSTSTGEVYRPERRPEPSASSTAGAPTEAEETPTYSGALDFVSGDSVVDLAEFEIVETRGTPLPPGGAGDPAPAGPPHAEHDEPPADDLFHFFRAAAPDRGDATSTDDLADSLRRSTAVMGFDGLVQEAVAAVPRLVDSGEELRALALVEALAAEARRPDRSRVFRDSAEQGLRRAATDPVLNRLAALLDRGGEVRARILRAFLTVGAGALPILENIVVRTGDAGVRHDVFRALLETDPTGARLLDRVMSEPGGGRARAVLELAALPGLDPALTQRWLDRGAKHPEPSVRAEVARNAARVSGRGGLRILLDLLGDADEQVRRAAARGLGEMGDPAAVPFLARLLNDSGDEDLQLEAIAALGGIGSAEALPVLTGILQKRQLFAGKRLQRLKLAGVVALGRVSLPAAREALASVASGRDGELAAEAKRTLAASP